LSATQPHVVIVGGGFGGLFATRELAGAPVSVTLIDKRNYHLFRPMLYQVATGLLSGDEIAGPLRSILNRQKNVEVLLDEVSGIDTEKRLVHLKQHVIPAMSVRSVASVRKSSARSCSRKKVSARALALATFTRPVGGNGFEMGELREPAAPDSHLLHRPQAPDNRESIPEARHTSGLRLPRLW